MVFYWDATHGGYLQEEGITRDLGTDGEFVLAHACPDEGATISLEISLPRFPGGVRSLRMQLRGTVVRVEFMRSGDFETGFAVCNEQSLLSEGGDGPARSAV